MRFALSFDLELEVQFMKVSDVTVFFHLVGNIGKKGLHMEEQKVLSPVGIEPDNSCNPL